MRFETDNLAVNKIGVYHPAQLPVDYRAIQATNGTFIKVHLPALVRFKKYLEHRQMKSLSTCVATAVQFRLGVT